MQNNQENQLKKGMGIHARRALAYIVLVIISFFCLCWFYILFVNATRSNSELARGFRLLPSNNFWKNWTNLVNGTIPILYGLGNSLLVSTLSAVLCTYFSSMTAYAIHAYDFK